MELYPAIDIRGGRVARAAAGGDPTAAGTDPIALVRAFASAGARWVHIVDLDRAYGTGDNRALTRAVVAAAPLRVQVGGGLHDADAIAELFDWGAARVVLGPRGVLDAALTARLLRTYGAGRLAMGIDARDGRVVARGSDDVFEVAPLVLAERVREGGARIAVYADARRDGTLAGADLAGAAAIAGTGLDVILAGGVASLADLRAARAAGLAGVIVGRALHAGRFTMAEALACLA